MKAVVVKRGRPTRAPSSCAVTWPVSWAPAADLVLGDDVLCVVDEAIAASGAGSDVPPAPPAHITTTPPASTPTT